MSTTIYRQDLIEEAEIHEKIMKPIYEKMANSHSDATFVKNDDLELQYKGVDVICQSNGKVRYIDEKCATNRLKRKSTLNSFGLEFSTNNQYNTARRIGWFLDDNLLTTTYVFIWGDNFNGNKVSGEVAFINKKVLREKILAKVNEVLNKDIDFSYMNRLNSWLETNPIKNVSLFNEKFQGSGLRFYYDSSRQKGLFMTVDRKFYRDNFTIIKYPYTELSLLK